MSAHRKLAALPVLWLAIFFSASVIYSLSHPDGPQMQLAESLHPMEWGHFFGFDSLGHDLQQVILLAAFKSSLFASLAVILSMTCALGIGAGIALLPALPRFLALRALDFLLAFPALLLALGWAVVRGPGWGTLLASLLIGILPSLARFLYAGAREILSEPYIAASQSMGARPSRILFKHLLPALGSVLGVKIPTIFAQALMAEATLSFLGVGAPIGKTTWGELLLAGRDYLFEAPHIAVVAGIPLVITILALQSLGTRLGSSPLSRSSATSNSSG